MNSNCYLCVSALPCSFEVAVNRMEDTDHVVIPVHLREKYKQSGYNHTSTPLFGQPFLITVPRALSEDKLYNMLLQRLWYASICSLSCPLICRNSSSSTLSKNKKIVLIVLSCYRVAVYLKNACVPHNVVLVDHRIVSC